MAIKDISQLGIENSVPQTITVGASAVEIAPFRNRTAVYIRNTSTSNQIINVVFSNNQRAVSLGAGFQLNVNESIVDSDSADYSCWTGAISAISSAAGGTIVMWERI
jgi:hypothetical protein